MISLRRVLVLALLTVAIVGVVVAAGWKSTANAGGKSPQVSRAAVAIHLQSTTTPPKGTLSTLTWGLFEEPTTLDYAKAGDYGPDFMVAQMADNLLRITPTWKIEPGIAKSWSTPNPLTIVYNIRKGVKFWDGHPLTAADVVYSLQREMNPATGSLEIGLFVNVKSIVQTGPYQVTVHFKQHDELFNKEVAILAGAVAEKAYVEAKGSTFGTAQGGVMYSGPFKLVKWVPGSEIILQRNDSYWNKSLLPKVKTVYVKFISNNATMTSALLSGQLDGAWEVPPTSIPELQKASSGKLYFGPSLQIAEMTPNADNGGPMSNPVLRRALSMAIDRQAIASTVYNGAASPNKTIIPPTAWDPAALGIYKAAWNALPSITPNIAEAKKLVAGQPDASKPIVLAYLAGDQRELEIASLVQQAGTEIGLNVQLKALQPLDISNVFYVPSYRNGIDLVLALGYLPYPDPIDYLVYFFGSSPLFNWLNYENATVNTDINEARTAVNPTTQATLVTKAQAIFTPDSVVIPLVNSDEALFMNKRVTGAPASFAYMFMPSLAMVGAAK